MTSTAIPPTTTNLRNRSQPAVDSPQLETPPPLPRRRSSLLSFQSFDDAKQSVRHSATDFILPGLGLEPELRHDGPSHWHSTPLVFAILPALGGLFFTNGTAFTTDILLLGLAAIFLNWSVTLPWEWYHSAQAVKQLASRRLSEALDDLPDEGKLPNDAARSSPSDTFRGRGGDKDDTDDDVEQVRDDAIQQLRSHETLALLSTFVLPALGAYLLHLIRGQLSRPSTGLVSDYNLSIFLLAAEIRPFRQVVRLMTKRTLHLQRVVSGTTEMSGIGAADGDRLETRITALEARLPTTDSSSTKITQKEDLTRLSTELRKRYEPRLDALERAVRRYEKRATTLTILTEQRLQSLESRIQDALSLAAAAAHSSQKPGKIVTLLSWLSKLITIPFEAAWLLLAWPINVVEGGLARVSALVLGPPARPRRPIERDAKSGRGKGKRREEVNGTGASW